MPDAGIAIAAGILFVGVTPIMWAGPLAGWVAALERLLGLGAARFVPGHGPACGPEEVRQLIDYWRWLDRAARQRLDSSTSPAEAARELVLGDEMPSGGSRTGSLPSGRWSAWARSPPIVAASPGHLGRAS